MNKETHIYKIIEKNWNDFNEKRYWDVIECLGYPKDEIHLHVDEDELDEDIVIMTKFLSNIFRHHPSKDDMENELDYLARQYDELDYPSSIEDNWTF